MSEKHCVAKSGRHVDQIYSMDQEMTEENSTVRIKQFWELAAEAPVDAQGLRPTARDPYLQLAVEDVIEGHLWPKARLLDVGCGDGYSTLRFAQRVASATGVDYIGAFVEAAKKNAILKGILNTSFCQGDVTDLSNTRSENPPFDIAISIRCLINLPEWSLQAQGLSEIASCVRSGGFFLCSEGWEEGWNGLNELRNRCGLDPIRVVEYNRLMTRREFEREAGKYFDVMGYQGLGFYLFVSRVLQPYFKLPDPPEHKHELNRIGRELQRCLGLSERFDDCDYAGVYIFKRR